MQTVGFYYSISQTATDIEAHANILFPFLNRKALSNQILLNACHIFVAAWSDKAQAWQRAYR